MSLIFALASTLAVLPAAAPTEADRAEARRLKNLAFEKISEGSYAQGIDLLEAAHRAVPHPTFLFNIAVVYDQWSGHCSESLAAFDRFFEACADCQVLELAERRFERVKEKCEVALSVRSVPPDALVLLDGGEVEGRTPFDVTLRPGRYRVRLEREGFEPHAEEVQLEPGRDRSLSVSLVPRATEPPRPDLAASAAPGRRPGALLRAWGWAALGAGAVGVAVGTVFAVSSLDTVEEADDLARDPNVDPSEVAEARDEARSAAVVSYVGYGVGLAGVGTGILLHVLAGKRDREAQALRLGTDGRGIVLSGRF